MLYLVQGGGRAIRYGIGVGRTGFTWSGVHHITNKREWPIGRHPTRCCGAGQICRATWLAAPKIRSGARHVSQLDALSHPRLNEPWTIGTQVSSGCIRMRNGTSSTSTAASGRHQGRGDVRELATVRK
jgi:hypothetical protein